MLLDATPSFPPVIIITSVQISSRHVFQPKSCVHPCTPPPLLICVATNSAMGTVETDCISWLIVLIVIGRSRVGIWPDSGLLQGPFASLHVLTSFVFAQSFCYIPLYNVDVNRQIGIIIVFLGIHRHVFFNLIKECCGDWILSPAWDKRLLRWAQSIELIYLRTLSKLRIHTRPILVM
jgi:hypothetical protein